MAFRLKDYIQGNYRSGKWSQEEMEYCHALIQAFSGGCLPEEDEDANDGITLRVYLAKKLGCNPKRISKKFEGSDYNGRLQYVSQLSINGSQDATMDQKKAVLHVLRGRFESSVKESAMETFRGQEELFLEAKDSPVQPQPQIPTASGAARATAGGGAGAGVSRTVASIVNNVRDPQDVLSNVHAGVPTSISEVAATASGLSLDATASLQFAKACMEELKLRRGVYSGSNMPSTLSGSLVGRLDPGQIPEIPAAATAQQVLLPPCFSNRSFLSLPPKASIFTPLTGIVAARSTAISSNCFQPFAGFQSTRASNSHMKRVAETRLGETKPHNIKRARFFF